MKKRGKGAGFLSLVIRHNKKTLKAGKPQANTWNHDLSTGNGFDARCEDAIRHNRVLDEIRAI